MPGNAIFRLPSRIAYHLWTLFLFTKSDMKAVVLPVVSLQPLHIGNAQYEHINSLRLSLHSHLSQILMHRD